MARMPAFEVTKRNFSACVFVIKRLDDAGKHLFVVFISTKCIEL